MDIGMLEKMLDAGFNKSEILSIMEKTSTSAGNKEAETPAQQEAEAPAQQETLIDVDALAKKIVGMIQQGNRMKDNSGNEEKKKSIDEILTSAISARK